MKNLNFIKNKKFIIIINLFLITTLMTVSVYSWFASMVDNRVDAYEIQVESDDSLELSFTGEDGTWAGTLNLADLMLDGTSTSVLDSMKFVEVTGNGETFYSPQLIQKNNYAVVNPSGDWPLSVANQDYLKFTVKMRSKEQLNVYLSSSSNASPAFELYAHKTEIILFDVKLLIQASKSDLSQDKPSIAVKNLSAKSDFVHTPFS